MNTRILLILLIIFRSNIDLLFDLGVNRKAEDGEPRESNPLFDLDANQILKNAVHPSLYNQANNSF